MENTHTLDDTLGEKPITSLEQRLIAEYLKEKGHTRESLKKLPPPEARQLLIEASRYASARLAELEARAHFVDTIHDATDAAKS